MTDILSISGIAIALFAASQLWYKNNKRPYHFLLIALLLNMAFNLAFFYWSKNYPVGIPFMLNLVGMSMPMIYGPLLFLVVKYTFADRVSPYELFHFIPWLFFVVFFSLIHYLGIYEIGFNRGFFTFPQNVPPIFYQYGILFALVPGVYIIVTLFQTYSLKKVLGQTQSSEMRNTFTWIQNWMWIALFYFVAIYIIIQVSVSSPMIKLDDTFTIVSVFISGYIFYVGFFGINRNPAIDYQGSAAIALEDETKTSLDYDQKTIEQTLATIRDFLQTKKIYLDPELSITQLAEKTAIPAGKISLAINRGSGKNFYDFINEYRVKEFISRLDEKESEHLSLLGLAYDCGFRSKSTFNAFFKRHTGTTPSQYKKNPANKSGKM